MTDSPSKYILLVIAFLLIGLILPSPLQKTHPPETTQQKNSAKDPSSHERKENSSRKASFPSQPINSTSHDPETLHLGTEVIEALIKSEEMKRTLPLMGLDEEQVKGVLEIEANTQQRMKDLEVKHAKLQTDAEGDYYAIEAFPEDHTRWMKETEQQLQDLIGDDRAVLISRMIAGSYNNESTGLYRREVRALKSESPETDIKIRESFFDEDGEIFDHDYRYFRGIHEDRWEHLFKPVEE